MAPVTFHKYGSLISPFLFSNLYKNRQQKNHSHIFYFSINIILNLEISAYKPIIKAPKGHEYHYFCSIRRKNQKKKIAKTGFPILS
jgi:hypothetical protein